MKYRALKARVAAAERRVGEHLADAGDRVGTMQGTVKQAMTPARILGAGLVGGLLMGWLRPMRVAAALPPLLKIAASMPGLLASLEPLLAPIRQGMQAAAEEDGRPPQDS